MLSNRIFGQIAMLQDWPAAIPALLPIAGIRHGGIHRAVVDRTPLIRRSSFNSFQAGAGEVVLQKLAILTQQRGPPTKNQQIQAGKQIAQPELPF
jgi:hypothetical protein